MVKGIVRFTRLQSLKNIIKRDCDSVLLCVIIVAIRVNMFIKCEIDHFLSERMFSGKVVVVYVE